MLRPKHDSQAGFTLIELLIVMVVAGLLAITFYSLVNNSFIQYFSLQKDGTEFTELASQSQRLANVLRGTTDIVSESSNDITCYAYFSPNDAYVSQIHYYKNANNTQLLADVTPMSANPPTGALLTAQKKTFTIISDFYQSPTLNTFAYLDDSGAVMSLPITDEHTIKGIQVNLAARGAHNSDQAISLQVSLRNRKTNL